MKELENGLAKNISEEKKKNMIRTKRNLRVI
jgi:hypothetical protein